MVLVLAIGDFHIPDRAIDLPSQFKKLMIPGRIHQILCTGNLVSNETYQYLKSVCNDIHVVGGDYDPVGAWPSNKIVQQGNFTIGLIHGHQAVGWSDREALALKARQLGADVLISGHTHQLEIYELERTFFINPGTATGAGSNAGGSTEPFPSFVLLDVQDGSITAYVYKLIDDEVKIDIIEYKKD